MVFGRGVPVISMMVSDGATSRVFHIGDNINNIVIREDVEALTRTYSGTLVGIELDQIKHTSEDEWYSSYDNIPTDGYVNPTCALAPNIDASQTVSRFVIKTADEIYVPIMISDISHLELYTQEEIEWMETTGEAVDGFINSIQPTGNISAIAIEDNVITATINASGSFDIGLVDFIAGIEGITSADYEANGEKFTMIIAQPETYEPFNQGILSTLPKENGQTTIGTLTLRKE